MPRTDGRPKIDGVCQVCGGEYYAKFYCVKHYFASRRKTVRELIPEDAVCLDCDKKPVAKGRCKYHYERNRKGKTNKPDMRGKHNGRRGREKKDVVDYRAAHIRVEQVKGKAATHHCVCGKPAQEWALDPLAVHTYEDAQGRVWSMNVDDYRPMCCSCHRNLDGQTELWYVDLWIENKV